MFMFMVKKVLSGPSGTPSFIPSKISQLSTGLDVYWEPPSMASINGEFLGYILSYRPGLAAERIKIEIRDESFKTQVDVLYLFSCFCSSFPRSRTPP